MKQQLLFIFTICFWLNAFSQSKQIVYSFKVKDPIFLDSLKTDYIGKEFEFKGVREIKSDTLFYEKGVIERDTNVVYVFKKSNKNWYIKKLQSKEGWKLFFNGDLNNKCNLQIGGITYKIQWSNACIWENSENYTFRLIPPKNITVTHLPIYIFNSINGIIGLKNNGLIFLAKT